MKGAQLYAAGDLRLEELPEPRLGDDEVLIRPLYSGVCGSELHFYQRGLDPGLPPPPRLLGHEFAGIVHATGRAVTSVRPGDRVTGVPWAPCGRCGYCRRGLVHHCTAKRPITGSFAERMVVAESAVYLVPPEIPLRRAALAEPVSCAVWALDQAGLRSGETVVIVGAGPLGLILLLLAQWSGAAQTIVAEFSPVRRDLAAQLGATHVVDPRTQDLPARVRDVTDGLGADVALEVVGHPAALRSALDCVRHSGTVVVVGVADAAATLPLAPFEVYRRELTIRGSYTRCHTYDRTLNWLRRAEFDRLISHELPLEEIVAGFELAGSAQCGKVLILPNGSPEG